jgi:6-phosphogluconolactonase
MAQRVKLKVPYFQTITKGEYMRNSRLMYIGTYTEPILFGTGQILQGKGKGIYAYSFDKQDGNLKYLGLAEGIINPSYVAVASNGRVLYAVNEIKMWQSQSTGTVSAYKIGATASDLQFLNLLPTMGTDPCHLAFDKSGRYLAVANFKTGSISIFSISADGSLGKQTAFEQHKGSSIDSMRQAGPHAHAVIFDPENRFLLVPDLGLDKVVVYAFDEVTGSIVREDSKTLQLSAGSGPRSLVFHPSKAYAYVINELSSTVTVMRTTGGTPLMEEIQTISTLPQGYHGDSTCADIHITPNGAFLYASNRGHNSLAIFKIHSQSGTLTSLGHVSVRGKTPRNFAIDPEARFILVANQDTDNIAVFRIDQNTGLLSFTGIEVEVPTPVCIQFVP